MRPPPVRRSDATGAQPARGGFTLLEVLVALAIFAMASIVLAGAYLNVLNGYDVAARSLQTDPDVAFARSLVLQQPDPNKVEQGGEFDTASGRHVQWSADIEPTNINDLFTVTFTCEVTEPNKSQPEKTVQTFTLLRPTWSVDPAEHDKLLEDVKTRILQLQGKDTNS